MSELWYVRGLGGWGIELYDTAETAESVAYALMDRIRPHSGSGDNWHEDIADLSWGELMPHGEARLVDGAAPSTTAPEDGWEDWQLVRLPAAEHKVFDRLDAAMDTARAKARREASPVQIPEDVTQLRLGTIFAVAGRPVIDQFASLDDEDDDALWEKLAIEGRVQRLLHIVGEDPFVEALRARGYVVEMDREDD